MGSTHAQKFCARAFAFSQHANGGVKQEELGKNTRNRADDNNRFIYAELLEKFNPSDIQVFYGGHKMNAILVGKSESLPVSHFQKTVPLKGFSFRQINIEYPNQKVTFSASLPIIIKFKFENRFCQLKIIKEEVLPMALYQ